MQRQGLESTYLSICNKLNKVLKLWHTDKPLLLYRCGYSQLINIKMEKMSFKPIGSGSEIYSDQFSKEGWYIVDQVDLRPNNSVTDKKLVAVIKAHLREEPSFKVEATSDKFCF